MPDWRVQLKQHHDRYISWDEFIENGKRLEKNRTNGEATMLSGPAREGLALLQGLLVCGNCSHAITVRYTGNGCIYPTYLCNRQHREGLATKDCMSFRCGLLDAAVSEEVSKALQPAELELALAALRQLEVRDRAILRQRQMRLERAEYEVANRLVANTLERRSNGTLLRLYPFWNHLTTALRTGLPQNEIREGGPNPFEALYAEPAPLKEFPKAMTGVSRGANLAIARKFQNFSKSRSITQPQPSTRYSCAWVTA